GIVEEAVFKARELPGLNPIAEAEREALHVVVAASPGPESARQEDLPHGDRNFRRGAVRKRAAEGAAEGRGRSPAVVANVAAEQHVGVAEDLVAHRERGVEIGLAAGARGAAGAAAELQNRRSQRGSARGALAP